jgi:ABC-type nitrate/sulfonate/bicarbonate transport system permease component
MKKKGVKVGKKESFWKSGRYLSILSIIVTLTAWFLVTREGFGLVKDIMLPSPAMLVEAVVKTQRVLLTDILSTLARVVSSLITGVALGVGVGILISFYKKAQYILDPMIESMRPVPIVAMIPFFLMWFGVAEVGKFILATLGVFCIMVVNTSEAIRNVPPIYIKAANTLGANKNQLYRRVIIPSIVPSLIGPFRTSMAMSFTLVVAAEFMGAQSGLGFRILDARRMFNTDVIFLGITIFGIISALLDSLVRKIAKYIVRWSERV